MKKTGVELIAIERKRQIEELVFDYTNQRLYGNEQLSLSAVFYALNKKRRKWFLMTWPWTITSFNPTPKNRIKELTKAGALIAAQIDYELNKKKNE